jgi:hypothetical protein
VRELLVIDADGHGAEPDDSLREQLRAVLERDAISKAARRRS